MPRLPAWVVLCLILTAPLLSAAPADTDPAAQIRQLLSRYRQTASDAAAQDAVVQELLQLGEEARKQLQGRVEQDWSKDLKAYGARFIASAGTLATKMRKSPAAREVPLLQGRVLDLARSGSLSKEQLTGSADETLNQLEKILQPEIQAVLESSRPLQDSRAKLLTDSRHLRTLDGRDPEPLVLAEESRLLILALAGSRQDLLTLQDNDQDFTSMDAQELAGIRELNRRRLLLGLQVLKIDPKLCDASRDHSKDMKKLNFFAHESPVPGKTTPWDRARNFGTSAGAENIASGSTTGEGAILQWWHSPGHFKNMLGDHRRIGLGREDTLWTQMFGS